MKWLKFKKLFHSFAVLYHGIVKSIFAMLLLRIYQGIYFAYEWSLMVPLASMVAAP